MKRSIEYTARARGDLLKLLADIQQKWGSEKAEEIDKQILAELHKIVEMPAMYPLVPHRAAIRRFVFSKQTSIYYRVRPSSIQIIHIWDNRDNPRNFKV